MRIMRFALLAALFAPPVLAQDTAGAWSPTFTARHGAWDVTCDARGEAPSREERCYIRYIDVYSPRPNFGVLFLFLEMESGTPKIALGREFETDLVASTLRVNPGWERSVGLCSGGPCEIAGEDAAELAQAIVAGGMLEVGFTDATDTAQLRQWLPDGFADAYADVTREAAARGL